MVEREFESWLPWLQSTPSSSLSLPTSYFLLAQSGCTSSLSQVTWCMPNLRRKWLLNAPSGLLSEYIRHCLLHKSLHWSISHKSKEGLLKYQYLSVARVQKRHLIFIYLRNSESCHVNSNPFCMRIRGTGSETGITFWGLPVKPRN